MDAFDNIQRVSHSHPWIVKTAYKRLKKLNTNTKYLDKIVLDYHRICIVDEIQVSFGRIGKYFWGFNHQKVNPNIVTIDKSISDGHPLFLIITTKELADRFNNGMEYLNSFGGNPVSASVGQKCIGYRLLFKIRIFGTNGYFLSYWRC